MTLKSMRTRCKRAALGMCADAPSRRTTRIKSETDPKKQNELISQQMNLISYIVGLGIGVSSRHKMMMNRFKKGIGGPVKIK